MKRRAVPLLPADVLAQLIRLRQQIGVGDLRVTVVGDVFKLYKESSGVFAK